MVGGHGLLRSMIMTGRAVIGVMIFTFRSFFEDTSPDMAAWMNLPQQDELYNVRKAAQVIAYFALKQGGRAIDVVKAVKLTYLADRESLRRWGMPLLHEPHVALAQGPVNQTTLDYINGKRADPAGWSRIIAPREGNTVAVQTGLAAADLDEFSRAELEVLEQTWERYGSFKAAQLVGWTHNSANVPEWTKPRDDHKSTPIPLFEILRAVAFPDPEAAIERIEAQRDAERAFQQLR
ncbi:MAG: DUF4065 domain-containing protein [Alphaproteobacteria bacterium]|nr:MAG: DUF4065 domain-containing protein [Alphaproteobacteria bacterium]